jgi:flagellar motor switch protein FliG
VRRTIFTFAHIPQRLAARDIPKIVRAMDQAALARAVAAAADGDAPVADFLLSNMSLRMAESLREAAGEMPAMAPPEADAAKSEVVRVIRELEAAGELVLLSDPD